MRIVSRGISIKFGFNYIGEHVTRKFLIRRVSNTCSWAKRALVPADDRTRCSDFTIGFNSIYKKRRETSTIADI